MRPRRLSLLLTTAALSPALAHAQESSPSPEPTEIAPVVITADSPSSVPSSAPPDAQPVVDHEAPPLRPPLRGDTVAAPRAHFALRLDGQQEFVGFLYAYSPFDESLTGGSAEITATWFHRGIVNDDAPHSLQPFLQRASRIDVVFSPGGTHLSATDRPSGMHIGDDTAWAVASSIGFDQYVFDALALWGSAGFRYSASRVVSVTTGGTPSDSNITSVPLTAGLGVRFGDTRIDLGYRVTPYGADHRPWRVGLWYDVSLTMRTIVRRYADLSAGAEIITGGARIWTTAGFFPLRTTGVYVSTSAARGVFPYTDLRFHDRLGGELYVTHWFTPGAGGTLSDTLLWTEGEPALVENVVRVSLFARW